MRVRALLIVALLMVLLPATAVAALTLPADLNGEIDGQPYRIRIPAKWNGTLLVYSYGYAEGYSLVPLTPLGGNTAAGPDEATLLNKGYALAGIRASGAVTIPGGAGLAGYNFKERIQSQLALTSLFRDLVGPPERTIAWGKSMGGLVALALVENHPGLFDAAVPLCPLAAGTLRVYDTKLDVLLAFRQAFGWNDAWGTPGALRPDLNVMTEVAPFIIGQEAADPAKAKWGWEFLRMVNHIPQDPSFYNPPLNFRYQLIWLAFAPLIEMAERAGGCAVQNVGRVYELSAAEVDELKLLGGDPEPLLAAMNEATVYADRNARKWVRKYYSPTGRISRPVLTLHTTHDAPVIPENEGTYLKLVTDQGNTGLLMQAYTTGNAAGNTHCTFLPAQYIAALDAMVWWLNTGQKPDAGVWFPASAGFDPSFVPGEWPWLTARAAVPLPPEAGRYDVYEESGRNDLGTRGPGSRGSH